MKKNIMFLILALIGAAFAMPVNEETARNAGQAFLSSENPVLSARTPRHSVELTLVYTAKKTQTDVAARTADEEPLFYVFGAQNGFVIVSGDNAVEPILAYSNKSLFDAQNISPALQYFLDGYKEQIAAVRENQLSPSAEITQSWENLLESRNGRSIGGRGPLVSAKWDQRPFYNHFTPLETPVGCVAVAMGLVMSYWKYPLQGTGSHSYMSNFGQLSANFSNTTYNWALIPDSLTQGINASSTNPGEQQIELARLLFHLGVSVEMQYGHDASGAFVFIPAGYRWAMNSQHALSTFFGYDQASMRGVRRATHTDNNWLSLIRREIDEGRPVIYAGDNANYGGHAWVCDGYDAQNRLHMNWGWGGYGDGFFLINNLQVAEQPNFTTGQEALIGIQPPRANRPFDIRSQSFNAASSTISAGDKIEFRANIANRGNNLFRGNFAVIIFDGANQAIDFAMISDTVISANSNVIFNFFNNAPQYLSAGNYSAEVYYAISGGNWLKFEQNNLSSFTVLENNQTSVRNNPTAKNNGIILENAVVSDFARISVKTPEPASVTVRIFDNSGNTVFTESISYGQVSNLPLQHAIVWNLSNPAGRFVANGAYLIIAEAKGQSGRIYRYSANIGVNR